MVLPLVLRLRLRLRLPLGCRYLIERRLGLLQPLLQPFHTHRRGLKLSHQLALLIAQHSISLPLSLSLCLLLLCLCLCL